MNKILHIIPGILLASLMVLLSKEIAFLPFAPFTMSGMHPISAVLIVIILGMLIGNAISISRFNSGINFSSNQLLQLAVILLGVRLDFSYLIKMPLWHIFIIVLSVLFAYLVTYFLASRFNKIDKEAATLLAFGTAICGSAAIAVIGGVTKAWKNNISLAVAVVALCGSVAMFLYPYLGKVIGLDANQFGLLAGVSVHSVPQAIGTGMIFSEEAGDKATITKLVRVLLLCPMIIIYFIMQKKEKVNNMRFRDNVRKYFPPFIVGFIAMSVLSSFGVFDGYVSQISKISSFLILIAMFSIGYKTNFRELLSTCREAIFAGLIASLLLFGFGLLLVML